MAVKKTQMYRKNLDTSETNLYPLTEAQYVSMENGQTVQEILSDRDSDKYTPVITNSSSTFKVGQGDNVDLSSSMKEGAYDSCVLKGKTMVNCIQEPSSKDVVLPYEFEDGQYVTINDTKESGALGVELKGQTLVNLIDESTKTPLFVQLHSIAQCTLGKCDKIKPSTTYTVFYTVTEQTSTANKPCFNLSSGSGKPDVTIEPTKDRVVFTTPSDYSGTGKTMRLYYFSNDTCKISHMVLLEGDYTDVDIPYFEGMTSCKMPTLHTVGKNLATVSNVRLEGIRSNSGGHPKNIIMKNIPVEEGKTYTISGVGSKSDNMSHILFTRYEHRNPTNSNNHSQLWNEIGRDDNNTTFTIPKGVKYVSFTFGNCVYNNNGEDGWMQWDSIQLEEGSVATTHEPHKSSILSLPEEVVLRSLPNGVRDTFNTRTGVYTQRIGEWVLNGSSNESWIVSTESYHSENISSFYIYPNVDMTSVGSRHLQCSLLPVAMSNPNNYPTYEYVHLLNPNTSQTVIGISKTKLATQDTTGLRTYLQANPLTIQYELKTPVITKINPSSTLKSWNTTTHIYSEIPENTVYPILSHSNPSCPVILKPSTKYSIVADSYSNNHTNSAIKFNLGGATASTTVGNRVTTITTPSTLSNELLTMSGRGSKLNNVMVIEGDVAGDEPYFEGMCDSKSPILSNVGKNLVNVDNYVSYPSENLPIIKDGKHSYIIENKKVGNWQNRVVDKVKLKANTTYTLSYDYELLSASVPMNYGTVINLRDDSDTSINISGDASAGKPRTFTPTRDTLARLCMYATDTSGGINRIKFSNIQLEESSKRTEYEPYKSNILSVNGDKIELTEDMFEQGSLYYDNDTFEQAKSFADDDSSTRSIRIRTKKLIKVKPNTTYRFSYKNSCQSWFYGYNMDETPTNCKSTVVGATEQVFTTNASTHYIALVLFKTGNPTITPSNYDYKSIQIAEVDKTIVLRSLPNGVCDTLNVETGEYVQRIGEVVLDGSYIAYTNQGDRGYPSTTSTAMLLNLKSSELPQKRMTEFACKDLPCYHANDSIWMHNTPVDTGISGVSGAWDFCIRLPYTITGGASTDSNDVIKQKFKEYLNTNPVTVQYELAAPIVTTIDIQGFPYAYTNGHVQLSSGHSGQSLTPTVEYSLSANKTGQIDSNTKRVSTHQKQLDDFEAMMLTSLVESAYDKAILQFDYEMQMMSLGGE